jgi:hypothetical protein
VSGLAATGAPQATEAAIVVMFRAPSAGFVTTNVLPAREAEPCVVAMLVCLPTFRDDGLVLVGPASACAFAPRDSSVSRSVRLPPVL